MTIPSGATLDFDAATLPGAHGDLVTELIIDGSTVNIYGMTVADTEHGRALEVEYGRRSPVRAGVSPSTTIAVLEPSAGSSFGGEFGRNVNEAVITRKGRPDPADDRYVAFSLDDALDRFSAPHRTIVMALAHGPEGRAAYVNGTKVSSTSSVKTVGVSGPFALPTGRMYRLMWWDSILSDEQIEDASHELLRTYGATRTVSWEPPLHDGGLAVSGYVVTTYIGGVVEEHELPADVLSLDVQGEGVIQVSAVNAAGRSTPVEITF